ncbi:MAG: hypothetical protein K0S37_4200 [Microbacterium sp.]|jgi:carbohydrate kinase (thermoresistant glucokinase family)|nr:hypothetical protein [Microbacterium sp.]
MAGVVVMGVSAAGKSSVTRALSNHFDVPWVDADALHPAPNVRKMAAGTPLDDEDRWPWLDLVGEKLASEERIFIACSALRRVYRDRLRAARPDAVFVHLHAERPVLASRAASREDHFMPPALLESQLATLEPLAPDERGVVVDVAPQLIDVVDRATQWILRNV